MTVHRKFHFSRRRGQQTIERLLRESLEESVIWQTSGAAAGRRTAVEGAECLNFGACSYMGLHLHPDLIEGTVDAVRRFGTQFPFSRVYLSSNLYEELEALLETMTGRSVLVGASTTLCHLAALPVLVDDADAVVIDQFAHASLHMATELLGSTPVVRVRHSRLDRLESLLLELTPKHKRVWYVLDGLYSMRGDFAPFDGLTELLARFPSLHLYVDDAHSTSGLGIHGRGVALERLPMSDRVVVTLSLNKAFSAAGGAIVVSDPELKRTLRLCGGPMTFSGPIQAPMLGAAVASAKLHLKPEFADLQAQLMGKILFTRKLAADLGINLISEDISPIFMLPYEAPAQARAAGRAFRRAGFYVCPVHFPAVPMSNPGIRFSISRTNELADIEALLDNAVDLQCRPAREARYHHASEAEGTLEPLASRDSLQSL
jgi:7-keto-8-aminopelargonate synthetase-like enzyme